MDHLRGTLRVFRAELVRLLHLRSTWGVGALLAACSAARALLAVAAAAASRQGSPDPVSSGAGWAPLVDGWRVGLVLGVLLILAFAARSLAGDREAGVLRLAVTRSVARPALVWGRLLLSPLLALVVVIITGLAAWLATVGSLDFGPFVEDGYQLLAAEELRAEVLWGALAVVPAMVATFALGLAVSALARSATGAVAGALGLFLAFDLFKEALGDGRYWVFAAHAPTLADTSAWSELPGVARGFSDAGFPAEFLDLGLLLPWPEALLLAILAAGVLARRAL